MNLFQILRNFNLYFELITIFIISVIFIALIILIIERIIFFKKIYINEKKIYKDLNDALSDKNNISAFEICEKIFSPLTNLIKAGLNQRNYSKLHIKKAIAQAVQLELPNFEKNLTVIGVLITFMPFISLIVIFISNIEAFCLLESRTINFFLYSSNRTLFTFIYVIFFTILISILYYYIINKKNDIILLFEKWANELVFSLIKKKKK